MKTLKWILFLVLMQNYSLFAQVPAFDKLEMLYDQQHYKLVYKKANRLLDKPEYDYSLVPTYYKSISALQLAQNPFWLKRNQTVFKEAFAKLSELRNSKAGKELLEAHQFEFSSLKADLENWLPDLKLQGDNETYQFVTTQINSLFKGVKIPEENSGKTIVYAPTSDAKIKTRIDMIDYARLQLGVPYVSAGETPSGFDCSGFTTYVFSHSNVKLPRRAKDQYEASQKIKEDEAMMGDLVFFSNGTEVSHVGILINEPNQPKVMIHASSSKGISIVELETSTYWKQRIFGYGRFMP